MKRAVIDIGSNSVRLLVSRDGVSLFKRVENTRLSEGLSAAGRLSEQPMLRTARAVAELAAAAVEETGAKPLAFATEAVRAAANGGEFTRLVKTLAGVDVEVLGGEIEAEIGFFGAAGSLPGRVGVLDVGGASTELSVGRGGRPAYTKSLPIGVVRILERCGEDRRKVQDYVKETLGGYADAPAMDRLVGIGGSATNLAAVAFRVLPYEPERIHGRTISLALLRETEDGLYGMSREERVAAGVHPKRADLIAGGTTLLRCAVEYLGMGGIVVSESDNLEGYLALKERGELR